MKLLKPKDILFVSLQLLLFLLFFSMPSQPGWHFPFWLSAIFFSVAIAGLLLAALAILQLRKNLTPFSTPLPNATLIETGLYKKIRHPVYTGLFLFFFGYSMWQANPVKLIISLLVLLLFYFKSVYEEKLLEEKFPDYSNYKERSHRFFPFL